MLSAHPTVGHCPDFLQKVDLALQANPHIPRRRLRIEAEQGSVRLKGSVDSFFQKQMAQEALRRLDGVERIENLLEVNWR